MCNRTFNSEQNVRILDREMFKNLNDKHTKNICSMSVFNNITEEMENNAKCNTEDVF